MQRKIWQWRRGRFGYLLRLMVRRRHVRGTWVHRMLGDRIFEHDLWHLSRNGLALGLAFGTLFAFTHLPMQMLCAALLAFFFRGNIAAAIGATWISNPLTSPFQAWAQYSFGRWLLGMGGGWDAGLISAWHETQGMPYFDRLGDLAHDLWNIMKVAPEPFVLGVSISAVLLALCAYALTYLGWNLCAFVLKRLH